jgi:hypothetical protein
MLTAAQRRNSGYRQDANAIIFIDITPTAHPGLSTQSRLKSWWPAQRKHVGSFHDWLSPTVRTPKNLEEMSTNFPPSPAPKLVSWSSLALSVAEVSEGQQAIVDRLMTL